MSSSTLLLLFHSYIRQSFSSLSSSSVIIFFCLSLISHSLLFLSLSLFIYLSVLYLIFFQFYLCLPPSSSSAAHFPLIFSFFHHLYLSIYLSVLCFISQRYLFSSPSLFLFLHLIFPYPLSPSILLSPSHSLSTSLSIRLSYISFPTQFFFSSPFLSSAHLSLISQNHYPFFVPFHLIPFLSVFLRWPTIPVHFLSDRPCSLRDLV